MGVHHEHPPNEGLRAVADRIPIRSEELVLSTLDLFKELRIVVGVEGRKSTEENVHNDTKRPDIALLIVASHVQHLGRYVARRAAWCLHQRRLLIEKLAQP